MHVTTWGDEIWVSGGLLFIELMVQWLVVNAASKSNKNKIKCWRCNDIWYGTRGTRHERGVVRGWDDATDSHYTTSDPQPRAWMMIMTHNTISICQKCHFHPVQSMREMLLSLRQKKLYFSYFEESDSFEFEQITCRKKKKRFEQISAKIY